MNLGDFSSLLQLGVGLHAGSAYFHLLTDIGRQPRLQVVDRLKRICEKAGGGSDVEDIVDRLEQIEMNILSAQDKTKRIFNKLVITNFVFSGLLLFILIYVSFYFQSEISGGEGVLITLASVGPVVVTHGIFVFKWRKHFSHIKDAIERVRQDLKKVRPKHSNAI